jgi:hypothetical protein
MPLGRFAPDSQFSMVGRKLLVDQHSTPPSAETTLPVPSSCPGQDSVAPPAGLAGIPWQPGLNGVADWRGGMEWFRPSPGARV